MRTFNHAVIEVVEVYDEPVPQQPSVVSDRLYAKYIEWFYSRPLSQRLIHSTTTIHQWR